MELDNNSQKITKDEIRDAVIDLSEYKFRSRFAFLKATNGIRPSSMSILLGTAGSGKSTLNKAIVADIASTHKVDLWLSEEDRAQYSIDLIAANKDVNFENINFIEERKFRTALTKISSYAEIANVFERAIKKNNSGIMIFDNLTTSALFDNRKPEVQANMFYALRDLAQKENVAIFCIAHTRKEINNSIGRMICQEDIQGSSSTVKAAQYFYILQQVEVNERKQTFIQITKHRGFSLQNKFFQLQYSEGSYVADRPISFSDLKAIWNKRDKL